MFTNILKKLRRQNRLIWRLRGCERCHGDLYLEGHVWSCLQCGHRVYEGKEASEYQ